jgi:hypothetical protein
LPLGQEESKDISKLDACLLQTKKLWMHLRTTIKRNKASPQGEDYNQWK